MPPIPTCLKKRNFKLARQASVALLTQLSIIGVYRMALALKLSAALG